MPVQGQIITTPSGEKALVVNIHAGPESDLPYTGGWGQAPAGEQAGNTVDDAYLAKAESREDAFIRQEGQGMGYIPQDQDPLTQAANLLHQPHPAASQPLEMPQVGADQTQPAQPSPGAAGGAAGQAKTWADDLGQYLQLENAAGHLDSVWKSIARTGVGTFRGFSSGTQGFFQSLDELATTVSDATGLPKGGLFASLVKSSDYWVKQSDKLYDLSWDQRAKGGKIIDYDKFITGLVGDVLGGAAPGMAGFVMDKSGLAAVKGYARDGITGAVTQQAKVAMLDKAMQAAQYLPYALRAAGTGGMFAADAYGEGEKDPTKLAAAFGSGAGMAAMSPQAQPREIRPVSPYEAAQLDFFLRGQKNLDEINRAVTGGEITPQMAEMLRFFAHIFPDRDAATTLKIVNELMRASDEAMAAAGMPGQPGRIVGGVRISRAADALRAALELYQGADMGTVVHENAHLFFDKMPTEAKAGLRDWYERETAGQQKKPIFDEFVAEKFTDWFLKNRLWEHPATRADGFGGYFGQAANRLRGFLGKVMGVGGATPPRDVQELFRQAATGEGGDVFGGGTDFTPAPENLARASWKEAYQVRPVSPEENIRQGQEAIQRALKTHENILDAMYKEDLGGISFYWGSPGEGASFKRGEGLAHIDAKHGRTVLEMMPEVIAKGDIVARQHEGLIGERVKIAYEGHTAVLSLWRNGGKDTWLLTGWQDEIPGATGEGNGPSGATLAEPMRTRPDQGAGSHPSENISTPETDGKDLTATPEFKQWSGGAPVVSRETAGTYEFQTGHPVVVEALHGTLADVEAFNTAKESPLGPKSTDSHRAIFLTASPGVAGDYAGFENLSPKMREIFKTDIAQEPGGNIIPTYVSMGNPLVVDAHGASYSASTMAKWVRQAREGGHDGLVVQNIEDSMYRGKNDVSTTYAVFDPAQVKSVFNRGTFDPSDPHISHSVKPLPPTSQWENIRSWEKVGDENRPWEIVDKAADAANVITNDKNIFGVTAKKAVNINLDRLKTEDDVKRVISQVSEALRPEMEEARRYVRSDKLVLADARQLLADDLGMTVDTLLQRQRGEAFNAEQAVAARMILISSADEVMRMAKDIKAGNNSDVSLLAFQQRVEAHAAIQAQVSGMAAEAGRALRSFRILAGMSDVAPDVRTLMADAGKMLEQAGGRGDIERLADTLVTLAETGENRVTQVGKAVKDARARTWKDWIFGYRYAAMLSGIPTHIRNTVGNSMVAMLAVPERLVASQIGIVSKWMGSTSEHVQAREVGALLFGYINSQAEALHLASDAFKTGQSQFGPQKTEMPVRAETTRLEKVADFLWEAISIPSKVLGAEDEYFKAINYRAELGAQAYRAASNEGLEGVAFMRRAQELMINPTEDMQRRALDAAKVQTFNNDLEGAMNLISRGLSASVVGKVFVPFVRTPYNIFKYTMARTPLAPIFSDFRGDWKAGGARRELAMAKMIVGSSLMSVATSLVANGVITGGGPSDKGLRSVWLQNFQPYSIKFGDTWFSYGNLAEPLSTYFALASDFYDAASDWKRDFDQGTVTSWELSTALVKAFSKNITDKTFLKGVSDLSQALADPDRYAGNWVNSFAGSFVPSYLGNWANHLDPEIKLVGSYLDAMLNRIPGMKSNLPPRRDIFGDPIAINTLGPAWMSPIRTKDGSDVSDIEREMLRLGMKVSMPDKGQSFRGVPVDLTTEEYSRLLDIMGHETQLGNIKEKLNDTVNKPSYQRLAAKSDGPDGYAAKAINNLLHDAKSMALEQLLRESPRIQGLVHEETRQK